MVRAFGHRQVNAPDAETLKAVWTAKALYKPSHQILTPAQSVECVTLVQHLAGFSLPFCPSHFARPTVLSSPFHLRLSPGLSSPPPFAALPTKLSPRILCRAVPRARRLTQRMLKGLQLAQARPEMKAQVEKVVAVVQVHTAAALCWDFNALWATLPSWLRYCLVLARPPPFSAKD